MLNFSIAEIAENTKSQQVRYKLWIGKTKVYGDLNLRRKLVRSVSDPDYMLLIDKDKDHQLRCRQNSTGLTPRSV